MSIAIVAFTKMQAQGNDFVVLDGLEQTLPECTEEFIRNITERRYGIGCDQLLILTPHDAADAYMRIFNNDASKAANCGNGLRCVGALLIEKLAKDTVSIALDDRMVTARKTDDGIAVDMGAAHITEQTHAHVSVEIGNPHSVFFEAVESFPEDRNIEIVTGQIADHVYIDIIERGAGRTPACGSGACATAAAIWHIEKHNRPQTIEMPGGMVTVSGDINNLILQGSVQTVFTGNYQLPS